MTEIDLRGLRSTGKELDAGQHEGGRGREDTGADVLQDRPRLPVEVAGAIEVAVEGDEASE